GCSQISDEGLKWLPTSLRTLNLTKCTRLKNAKFYLPHLLDLNMRWCSNLTDESLPFLPSTLTVLNISECYQITLKALKQHLPASLTRITLNRNFLNKIWLI